MKGKFQEGIQEPERLQAQIKVEPLKIPLQILKSIQLAADGQKCVLRMELDPTALLAILTGASAPVEVQLDDDDEEEDDE